MYSVDYCKCHTYNANTYNYAISYAYQSTLTFFFKEYSWGEGGWGQANCRTLRAVMVRFCRKTLNTVNIYIQFCAKDYFKDKD